MKSSIIIALLTSLAIIPSTTIAFLPPNSCTILHNIRPYAQTQISSSYDSSDDSFNANPSYEPPPTDPAGLELMNEFSALLSSRNIQSIDDLAEEEDVAMISDGFLEEVEAEYDLGDDYAAAASVSGNSDDINNDSSDGMNEDDEAFLEEYTATPIPGYESTDANFEQELDENIQERMTSSPNSLVNLNLDVDMDIEDLLLEEEEGGYIAPEVVPDSGLSAREVVMLVATALRNNDTPTPNRGIEIFFSYSSPISQVYKEIQKGMTPQQYKDFLLYSSDYASLFDNDEIMIEKSDVNYNSKKGYFTVRLFYHDKRKVDVSVNFILSIEGDGEEDCWMVDSMLIRPSLRRNRRRQD
ncbi:hypothetical protein ACHAXN_002490 [Cyclotella atomus]